MEYLLTLMIMNTLHKLNLEFSGANLIKRSNGVITYSAIDEGYSISIREFDKTCIVPMFFADISIALGIIQSVSHKDLDGLIALINEVTRDSFECTVVRTLNLKSYTYADSKITFGVSAYEFVIVKCADVYKLFIYYPSNLVDAEYSNLTDCIIAVKRFVREVVDNLSTLL